jgi:hypothetical protein
MSFWLLLARSAIVEGHCSLPGAPEAVTNPFIADLFGIGLKALRVPSYLQFKFTGSIH